MWTGWMLVVVSLFQSDAGGASGWSSRVLLETDRGLGGVVIGDLYADAPGNEIAAVSANGDIWFLRQEGDEWRSQRVHTAGGELIMAAIGDVDPRYSGNEFVGVGMVEGEEALRGAGQALMLHRDGDAWRGQTIFTDSHMLHGVAIGDVSARSAGNEVVVCGFNHRVTLLRQVDGAFVPEVMYVGDDRQKIVTIADALRERGGLEVVVCGSDGRVVVVWEEELGWRHEVIFAGTVGQSRVAVGRTGVLIGGDDGEITFARRVDGRWTHESLGREEGKIRGTALVPTGDHLGREKLFAAGYACRVVELRLDGAGNKQSVEIYKDEKPLHHLVAGELDHGGRLPELLTCGHGGRLIMLTHAR